MLCPLTCVLQKSIKMRLLLMFIHLQNSYEIIGLIENIKVEV